MSIIIREPGAMKIEQKVLESLLCYADGWGITWVRAGRVGFFRSYEPKAFIESFRKKEAENLRMVIHFNEFPTGSPCKENLQPVCVKNVGVLTLDGWVSKYPEAVDEYFGNHAHKSDETIVGGIFKEFCLQYDNLSPIALWNRFLIENRDILENMSMVLVTNDGVVLNSDAENGHYIDKGKLWLLPSDDEAINGEAVEDDEISNIDIATSKLARWDKVTTDDFVRLSRTELIKLCHQFPRQIAEVIKYGISGFDNLEDWEEEAYEKTNKYMLECSDCGEWQDKEFCHPITIGNTKTQICDRCVEVNGLCAV